MKDKILVLPGMGASSAMYAGPWENLENTQFLNWPTFYNSTSIPTSIAALAEYMARDIHYTPRCIIGSSLGGMVALELAQITAAESVALIGSALSSSEVNILLRVLTPLAAVTPMSLCQILAGKSSCDLTQMFAEQNPEFIRAMIQAVPSWEYSGRHQEQCKGDRKILRIHGTKDHIISCTDADLYLPGGHLLAMTHADACVQAIQEWLEHV